MFGLEHANLLLLTPRRLHTCVGHESIRFLCAFAFTRSSRAIALGRWRLTLRVDAVCPRQHSPGPCTPFAILGTSGQCIACLGPLAHWIAYASAESHAHGPFDAHLRQVLLRISTAGARPFTLRTAIVLAISGMIGASLICIWSLSNGPFNAGL